MFIDLLTMDITEVCGVSMTTEARQGPEATVRSYRGTTPLERDSDWQVRLHEAALDLFSVQGFAATTIADVGSCARVSTRTFYQKFKDKEALFGEV